ncbi:MAG: phosphoribosylpyrophosphate synthetase [Flavobacterium sp.]|uniref:ribose-phosphate diphosphokinase n=1 Tax=Flavobacterium sp. TaxID=239 RepID=UPI000C688BDB|nr:ribose-phosphate diphosphokinase [Flavobacterium sp.]MBF02273.1 phosphoribosylpyrophosphate synthetase [Flavobacterium sp.]|tara:strand:- start:239 stop:1069 length:831 start_codon:yes stop_codon:yes gene_type:complete
MILNLDPHFAPLGIQNTIAFQSFVFSGGEPHIKIVADFDTTQTVFVTHRLNSFNDLGLFCLAVDALRRMGVKTTKAIIPYFPAARQDRVMIPGEPLSVKVYADIINALQLEEIQVFDPHSEVTPALLNNCTVIPNYQFVQEVIQKIGNEVLLISPDGGALKKIYKVSEYLGGVEVVECSKSRDVKTGKLSGFKVYSEDLEGKDCLIVDDICDGGGTFIGLAEELKSKNAGNLYLAVSHGIFNKGFDSLHVFEKIFTTNSFKDIVNDKVEVLPLVIK